jgi:hypothetical protein
MPAPHGQQVLETSVVGPEKSLLLYRFSGKLHSTEIYHEGYEEIIDKKTPRTGGTYAGPLPVVAGLGRY